MGKVLESKSFYGSNWWNNTRPDYVWTVCTIIIKYPVSQNHLGWERPLRSLSQTLPSPPLNHISAPLGFSWGISWTPSRLSPRGLLSARLLNRPKSVPWRSEVAALLIPLVQEFVIPVPQMTCITHKSFSLCEQQVQQVPSLAGSLTSWVGKFSSTPSRHILDIPAPAEQGPATVRHLPQLLTGYLICLSILGGWSLTNSHQDFSLLAFFWFLPPNIRPYCHHCSAQTLKTVPNTQGCPSASFWRVYSHPSQPSSSVSHPKNDGSCSFPAAQWLPAPPVCCLCCVQGCRCISLGISILKPFLGGKL